jgi:hypothetical protein
VSPALTKLHSFEAEEVVENHVVNFDAKAFFHWYATLKGIVTVPTNEDSLAFPKEPFWFDMVSSPKDVNAISP